MKKLYFTIFAAIFLLASCKPVLYMGSYGQVNQTQVVLSEANFKVLGSFTGSATENKAAIGLKNKEGLVAQAKANLISKAKMAGVELTGSRTLTNVSVDVIQNSNKVMVTVSAEIVEFLK